MKANYENCLAITLKWEGGDSDHPDDPGGKTRWGITQAVYTAWLKTQGRASKSVFTMTRDEMLAIYKANYWNAVKGDTLAPGVDLATWDYGVNSGPARARSALLSVIGGSDVDTVKKLCAKRLSFVKGLKTWKTFGKGWSNRIADIEARGVKMALAVLPATTAVRVLESEADKARTSATDNANGAAVSGGAGAATTSVGTFGDVDQWVAFGLFGAAVLAVIAVIYFARKSAHDKERADAYERVAAEGA